MFAPTNSVNANAHGVHINPNNTLISTKLPAIAITALSTVIFFVVLSCILPLILEFTNLVNAKLKKNVQMEETEKQKILEGLTEAGGVAEATAVLRLLSHPERLKILCHLGVEGELCVGAILERIPLSGSALSQHLAKLRKEGLVGTRKDRQTVFYRVAREDVMEILGTLHGLYCK
jgi:DNA-binding transcriptional ArsR family regulator